MAADFSQHSWLVISTAIMVAYFVQHSRLFIAATALMAAYVFRNPQRCLFSQHSELFTQGCLFLLTALFCLPTELSALWKFVQRLVCMASCGAFMCHHISLDDWLFFAACSLPADIQVV
jgi:hypothetical protein